MGSALGLLITSIGAFLAWAGWTGVDPIKEVQAALGADVGPTKLASKVEADKLSKFASTVDKSASAPVGGGGRSSGSFDGGGRSSGTYDTEPFDLQTEAFGDVFGTKPLGTGMNSTGRRSSGTW